MHAARFVLVLSLVLLLPVRSPAELVDGIAAQVGTEVVLVSDVLQLVYNQEERYLELGADKVTIAQLRAEGLEQLIERALISQIVNRAELHASEGEIDRAIKTIAKDNDLTLEQLRESVESQGLAYDAYRERIRTEVEQSKVINSMVRSRVAIEEEQVVRLFDQRFADQPQGGEAYRLRQILATMGEDGKGLELACNTVRTAEKRIAGGEEFAKVAQETSALNPETGGDIGWIHEDSLSAWMKPVVQELELNQVSNLVELPFGCSLLQLVDRNEYTPMTYERAKPALYAEVYESELKNEYEAWMEQLRTQTYIERKGYFADAARLRTPIESIPEQGGAEPNDRE